MEERVRSSQRRIYHAGRGPGPLGALTNWRVWVSDENGRRTSRGIGYVYASNRVEAIRIAKEAALPVLNDVEGVK